MLPSMQAFAPHPTRSILGLALTLDRACPVLHQTLDTLRTHPGIVLDSPQLPFAALTLETSDTRRDHAWLESLPGVIAVDVVFVEVLPEEALSPDTVRAPRRRSRDPVDDSPQPHEALAGAFPFDPFNPDAPSRT